MARGERWIAVDVETTGYSPLRGGRVIEVAAIVIENRCCTDEFHTLVDVSAPISAGAFRVHGISKAMLDGQPRPDQVWSEFRDFVGNSPLVAHNAPFDRSFILQELNRQGHAFVNPWHCTVKMGRKHLPYLANHKLETIARHLFPDLPRDLRLHRAIDDARLTARIWLSLIGG